jgi:uncharacterized protein YqfB (UPF0267 family)
MDDEAGGIFNIALSDSETEETPAEKTARRTDQSESDFQAVKVSYSAKVENGNIAASLKLPLGPDASKPVVQEAIHAVEELYFFRRFDEGINLVDKLLAERPDGKSPFDSESTRILQRYRSNCESKKSMKQTT